MAGNNAGRSAQTTTIFALLVRDKMAVDGGTRGGRAGQGKGKGGETGPFARILTSPEPRQGVTSPL